MRRVRSLAVSLLAFAALTAPVAAQAPATGRIVGRIIDAGTGAGLSDAGIQVVGTTVGIFFGVPGILLGPFLGALVGELIARRNVVQAGKAGVAAWIGFIIGTLGKLAIMFTMVGVFVVMRLL